MSTQIERIAVIGAGSIGISWSILLASRSISVALADPSPVAADQARGELRREVGDHVDVEHFVDAASAVEDAQFVIECGPERVDVKQELFRAMDEVAPPDVVLSSSSSGLTPSDIQRDCAHPGRVLVAHPFNPPHLVPLVEVVGGRLTSQSAVDEAMDVMRSLGKYPIHVRRELPGHVVNRLQAALWREAYYLVEQGAVSVTDIDQAVANGPGLRWALLGPLATQHLSGGPGGLRHVLEHLGPPMVDWWHDLGSPELDEGLIDTLVAGVEDEMVGEATTLRDGRDAALRALLQLKESHGLTTMPGAREQV